ncbi:hypothetical protein ACT0JU_003253 [Cronobacter dublinensis]
MDDLITPDPAGIHFGTHNVYYVKLHLMPELGYLAIFVCSHDGLPCNAHSQNPSAPRIMPLRYAKSGWLSLVRFLRIHVAHRFSYRLRAPPPFLLCGYRIATSVNSASCALNPAACSINGACPELAYNADCLAARHPTGAPNLSADRDRR